VGNATETFQIPPEAAEAYESAFVPRLFGEWARLLVDSVDFETGDRVLDVACGTGIVARLAAESVGQEGRIVGLDLNQAMLDVARRFDSSIEWRQGDAASLPFADHSFDIVFCQAALMFFPDPTAALREMARVADPRATLAIQVWDRTPDQPAYRPFIEVAARHAGAEVVSILSAYFALGDLEALRETFRKASLDVAEVRTESTTMHFASVEEFVDVEVRSTPLGERLTEQAIRRIINESRTEGLSPFVTEDGRLDVPIRGHLIKAHKR
jgi:ubiquinone/menaquinone biosynthesis C-methylase UbiE